MWAPAGINSCGAVAGAAGGGGGDGGAGAQPQELVTLELVTQELVVMPAVRRRSWCGAGDAGAGGDAGVPQELVVMPVWTAGAGAAGAGGAAGACGQLMICAEILEMLHVAQLKTPDVWLPAGSPLGCLFGMGRNRPGRCSMKKF